jgi:hypothetical protein
MSENNLCYHLQLLQKNTVNHIIANPPKFSCALHSDSKQYFLCLHCSQIYCDNTMETACIEKHRLDM